MKKQAKRFLSAFLVSLLLSQEVLADVTAPALPAGSAAPMATASNAIEEGGEPFYYDDVSEGEYVPDNILSRYEKSFEYCPITPDDVLNPRARIAIADDAVYFVLIALFAGCGLYLSKLAASSLASSFDTYIRRTSGNVASVMSAWNSVLSAKPGAVVSGLKVLYPLMKKFLKTNLTGYGTDVTEFPYVSGTGSLDMTGPYNRIVYDNLGLSSSLEYTYFGSIIDFDDSNYTLDLYFRYPDTDKTWYPTCFFTTGSYLYVCYISDDNVVKTMGAFVAYRRYDVKSNSFLYSETVTNSFINCIDVFAEPASRYVNETYYLASVLNLPFFRNSQYATQYAKYGYLDGQIVGTPDTSITAQKSWADLSDEAYAPASDTIVVPDITTQDSVLSQLQFSDTAADALTALSPVLGIEKSSGGSTVAPVVAYTSLAYILDAIAGYAGAGSLTAEQRNGFLADYFHVSSTGLTIDQLNAYAQTIVKGQVYINGTAEDNDANTFVITSSFTSAFLSYLLSIGLIDTIPEVKAGTQLKTNVKVETKIDTGTTTPDGGTTDLTGIVGLLTSILSALGGLPGLIASEAIKALTSSAFANGITLNLDTIRSALNNIAQWDFADWTTALGAAVLLALKTFAIDLRLDGLADVLDSIARWDFADWDTSLGNVIKAALSALGFDRVAALADVLATWDFADWSSVFRSVLDAALAASGLAGLAGILSDILAKLKDLGINIDLSPLTGLKDAVIAIPGKITDFFTIDTAVLADAFTSLQTTFTSRFSGISQLASVFERDYSFTIEYPVIRMAIPEDPPILRQMFDGKSEIVFLDLNPFAENLAYVRSLLIAMLYVAFAFWFLGEFDVKFHIG